MSKGTQPNSGDLVWNFAYGSNMHSQRLARRANIVPLQALPAVLSGWRLAFNMWGIPLVEPSMASVTPDPSAEVHGVALQITRQEFRELVASEGGDKFYRRIEVEVRTYDGDVIPALIFSGRPQMTRPETPPSERYLNLLRDGAQQNNLHQQWQDMLREHECVRPNPVARYLFENLFKALDQPRLRPCRTPVLNGIHKLVRAWVRFHERGDRSSPR